MSDAAHIYEPGLQLDTPRRVHVRAGLAALVVAACLLVTVLCLCALGSVTESARLLWLSKSGVTVTGTVTALYYGESRELTYDPDRARQISALEYRFIGPDGSIVTAKAPLEISRAMFDQQPLIDTRDPHAPHNNAAPQPPRLRYLPGQPLRVRYLQIGGGVYSRPWDKPPAGHAAFLFLSGLALFAITLGIACQVFSRIYGAYHLARYGDVSPGVIREKIARNEDTVRYFVRFGPAAPDLSPGPAAAASEWTRRCSAQQFLDFAEDQKVTLIAPPGKPDETTLFRLLPFGR